MLLRTIAVIAVLGTFVIIISQLVETIEEQKRERKRWERERN